LNVQLRGGLDEGRFEASIGDATCSARARLDKIDRGNASPPKTARLSKPSILKVNHHALSIPQHESGRVDESNGRSGSSSICQQSCICGKWQQWPATWLPSVDRRKQVGGTSIEDHGRYVLGDDALGCLKDLRRWIKFYDQKLNRLDVQRVLAESNLVKGDLLEILAGWPEDAIEDQLKSKIALACRKFPLDFRSCPRLTRISGALSTFDLAIGH